MWDAFDTYMMGPVILLLGHCISHDKYSNSTVCYVSLRTAALGLLCDLSYTFQLLPPGVCTRVTTQEHPAAEGGTVGEKCPGILPKCRIPRYI